jgi:hypothetical protein
MEEVDSIQTELLHRLRFVSKQATIPRAYHSCFPTDGPGDSLVDDLPEETIPGAIVRDYSKSTAVTDEVLDRTVALPAQYEVPVHGDVLLDAIEAQVTGDYRKAILYAAIGIESLAQERLEAAYVAAVEAPKADPRLRLIDRPVPGNDTTRKDPIYEHLSAGTHFGRLLHERPLYLLGRSVLLDKEKLYKEALELYGVRNKIAHRGSHAQDQTQFPSTREGL